MKALDKKGWSISIYALRSLGRGGGDEWILLSLILSSYEIGMCLYDPAHKAHNDICYALHSLKVLASVFRLSLAVSVYIMHLTAIQAGLKSSPTYYVFTSILPFLTPLFSPFSSNI